MITRIRVRAATFGSQWLWELLTSDGHVAASSPPFATRAECEADALRQGLPVTGLRKGPRARGDKAVTPQIGLVVSASSRGIWTWKCFDLKGELISTSATGFLTRDECERDAKSHAPIVPLTTSVKTTADKLTS